MPNYDELLIAYRDHSTSFDPAVLSGLNAQNDASMAHIIVMNGLVIGGWRRTVTKREVSIETNLLVRLEPAEKIALTVAVGRYSQFMGLPTSLVEDSAIQDIGTN